MFNKKWYCLLSCFILFCQGFVFAEINEISETTEWIMNQKGQLTQGVQDDIVEKIEDLLTKVMQNSGTDGDSKNTIRNLYAMISESMSRLEAKNVVRITEIYADLLLTYMQAGNMSSQEVQWLTNEFIELMGKRVSTIEDINKPRTQYILKKIVEENMLIQGGFGIKSNQRITMEQLKEKLLDIEKAHRVTSTQVTSFASYKELGREVSRSLVLKSTMDSVDVTLVLDLMEKMVEDQINLVINDQGIYYEVPVAFMEKHVGDFKITIDNITQEAAEKFGTKVEDGTVVPVITKDVRIGYSTNKTPIVVKADIKGLLGDFYGQGPYAWLTSENDTWNKSLSNYENAIMSCKVKGTGIIALAKYKSSYTDLTGHWAEDKITTLLSRGTSDRLNTQVFEPNGVMTRGEFVRMLINIVGTEGKSDNFYVDVPENSAYSDIIENVIYYGFTIGVPGNEFNADAELTREELVVLVAKMHEVKYGYMLDEGFITFRDMNDIAPYALDAVKAMREAGYINGYDDNTFKPKNAVTRAEAISVLYGVLGE